MPAEHIRFSDTALIVKLPCYRSAANQQPGDGNRKPVLESGVLN